MYEPGLDRHLWETQLAQLEEALADDPAGALPELADLVQQMLVERGYDIDDPVTLEGEERDVVAEYFAAREVADRARAGETPDPGDVGQAVEGLLALSETLLEAAAP